MLVTESDNLNMTDINEFLLPGSVNINGAPFDFDIENPFSQSGDILQQLTNDLEIPMLLEEDEGCGSSPSPPPPSDSPSSSSSAAAPMMLTDEEVASLWQLPKLEELNMDTIPDPADWDADIPVELLEPSNDWSGVKEEEIKLEPRSPLCSSVLPPSPSGSSSSSNDSGVHCWLNSNSHNNNSNNGNNISNNKKKVVLDTPPVSPPGKEASSPQPAVANVAAKTTPLVMVSPVNLLSINPTHTATGTPASLIFTTGKQLPTKRIKIQPRPIKVEQPDSVSTCGALPTMTTLPLHPRIKVVPKQELMNGEVPSVWSSHLMSEPLPADLKVPIPAVPPRTYTVAPGQQNSMELKLLKKHQRMIKNRESACQSRRKKKEYVTSLEAEIDSLRNENNRLKQDNAALRERLSQYDGTNNRSGLNLRGGKGAATALFAVLLVASLNVGPFSNLLPTRNSHVLTPDDPELPIPMSASPSRMHGSGRSLLWAASMLPESMNMNTSTSGQPTCPVHINLTESRRLDSELRGWFEEEIGRAGQDENITAVTKLAAPLLLPTVPPAPQPSLRLKKQRRKRPIRRKYHPVEQNQGGEIALYSGPHKYAALMDAIRRRDDTFYVVSLSGDHLLLPARSHNHTLRPKVSLVMPTNLGANGSIPQHHVAMMQIDCEVTDTRLIHIDESFLPAKLRANNTEAPPTSPAPATKQKKPPADSYHTNKILGKSEFNYDPAMHYKTHKALFHHTKDFP